MLRLNTFGSVEFPAQFGVYVDATAGICIDSRDGRCVNYWFAGCMELCKCRDKCMVNVCRKMVRLNYML